MATVTDLHVAALHAHLVGEYDEFERLCARPEMLDAKTGLDTLHAATFIESVHRRFDQQRSTAEIIQFVAAVRARLDPETADELDPGRAERLIKVTLGEMPPDPDLDDTAKALQIPLLNALIADERLDDSGLKELLTKARALADKWSLNAPVADSRPGSIPS
jgi:hypothetical protein